MTSLFDFPLPPFLLFFIAALIVPFLKGRVAATFCLAIPVLSFVNLLQLDFGVYWTYEIFGKSFNMVLIDRLSIVFAYLFHLAAFIGLLFAFHVKDKVQQVSALAYSGGAIGAVLAGDWLTLFMFWEVLALTSVFLIWARRSDRSYASGMRYLIIQVLSGVLLLAGAMLLISETGETGIRALELGSLSTWMIFMALGIKCGFPLFHTWIPDSYPEATPTGTIFMCSFTTKLAIYAFARVFAGEDLLLTIGLVMACLPIVYAVIENDLRRVLAYSMISSSGFMLCAIGVGTQMAINGAVATAFNHVIYQGLLMMTMGAVLYRVGHVNASNLGGLYKSMPWTTVFCILGAASLAAVPLFSGFVSKAIIMAEVLKQGHEIAWLLLLFAAAGVLHYAGLKVPFFAFFAKDSGLRPKEAPWNMLLAMGIAAFICLYIGIYPEPLYSIMPFSMKDYSPYDLTHVLTQLQILFFSALAFVLLKLWKFYPSNSRSINLDTDWFYRKLGLKVLRFVVASVAFAYRNAVSASLKMLGAKLKVLAKFSQPQGLLARAWGLNYMLLILLALMVVILSFNYHFF